MAPPLATASRAYAAGAPFIFPFIVRGVRIMSARLNIGLIGSGFMGRHTLTLTVARQCSIPICPSARISTRWRIRIRRWPNATRRNWGGKGLR